MPWIENISVRDIAGGNHRDAGPNSMLIQILDQDEVFPKPKKFFKEIYQFKFLDLDDGDLEKMPEIKDLLIQPSQAEKLVNLLRRALRKDMNVVVHCYMGICRSGAVVEIAQKMGFDVVENFRDPNTRVLRLMNHELEREQNGDKS